MANRGSVSDYREFGRTGFKVSVVGMGSYLDPLWIMVAMCTGFKWRARRIVQALRLGLEADINLIDTAEVYRTEPLVAEAVHGMRRDDLFIATKVWPSHLTYDKVIRACEKSLERLRTSYIDLYQIHWPSSRVPIRETMRAMQRLIDEGNVKHIGVSNFSLEQMIEAEEALGRTGLASTQMSYSLSDRRIEEDILPYCEKRRIAILAYFPIAHGRLSKPLRNEKCRIAMEQVSKKHGGKTLSQIALNWLISKSAVVFPIPRGSNPVHVGENVGATGWRLDEGDIQLLGESFPRRKV